MVLLKISEDKYGPVSDFGLVLKALVAVLAEIGAVGGSHEISLVPSLHRVSTDAMIGPSLRPENIHHSPTQTKVLEVPGGYADFAAILILKLKA